MKTLLYQNTELIRDAKAKYFQLNDLPPDGGISDKWARYKIGPVLLTAFPNFPHRVDALSRHDLHHIINDLDASNLGEGFIAAWELGSGCGKYWISWFMESQALWFGIFMAPVQTWSHFLRGRHSRNYFHEKLTNDILDQTVGRLRAQFLPLDAWRINSTPIDAVTFMAAALLGIFSMLIFIPIVSVFTLVGIVKGEASLRA